MDEMKSDFIRDNKILQEEAQNIAKRLREKLNLSIAQQSNISVVTKKGIGGVEYPTVHLRNVTKDFKDMLGADGWKYGTYYLDGPAKTGFYKMKDGKYMFIEVEEEHNTLATDAIDNAQSMKRALIAKNPLLDDTNVHVDGSKITIGVPFLDHLEMPSTEWVYDAETGKIHSTAREYAFDVVVTNAASMNDGYKTADGTSRSIESRESLSEDNSRVDMKTDDVVVSEGSEDVNVAQKNNLDIDAADFSPKKMYELFQTHRGNIDQDGKFSVGSAEGSQDRRSTSLNLKENEQSSTLNQQEKEWLFMATLWVNACLKCGKEKEEQAFEDSNCQRTLGTIMYLLKTGERKADVILNQISNLGCENAVEIAYTFLTSLTVQAGYEIDLSNVDINQLIKNQNEAINEYENVPEMKPQGNKI